MRRDFPVYAVRCAPRSLVSGAGGGGRGADVRSGSGGRRVGRGAAAVAGGDDEPDVPGAQERTGGGDSDAEADRKRGVMGKSGSVSVDIGGCRRIKKKK